MAYTGNENNNNGNTRNNNGGGIPCHNSLRRLAHIVGAQRNSCQTDMKIGLLQILYANYFEELNNEDPYIISQSSMSCQVHSELRKLEKRRFSGDYFHIH